MIVHPSRPHSFLDARSLALHQLIAQKIVDNPDLLQIAKDNIVRWAPTLDPHSAPYMKTWQEALDAGVEATVALMTEDSERGRELRQSAPFAGTLSHKERFAFFRSWEQRPHEKG